MALRHELERVAAQMIAERQHFSLAEWDAGRDQAVPNRDWVTHLRRVNWPMRTVEVDLPEATSDRRTATQAVTVVPASWLRYLARQIGVEWPVACRWEIPDAQRQRGRPRKSPHDARERMFTVTDEEHEFLQKTLQEFRSKSPTKQG